MIVTSQKSEILISNYWRPYRIMRRQAKESVLPFHPIKFNRERKLEKRNISQTSTAQRYSLINSTEKDSFIRNSANAHWQTVCMYARSIRCANSFSLLQQAVQVRAVQRLGGGRGCNKFVSVLGGDGTKIAPTGDLFGHPPSQMR